MANLPGPGRPRQEGRLLIGPGFSVAFLYLVAIAARFGRWNAPRTLWRTEKGSYQLHLRGPASSK
jgi:hypothetical protein